MLDIPEARDKWIERETQTQQQVVAYSFITEEYPGIEIDHNTMDIQCVNTSTMKLVAMKR